MKNPEKSRLSMPTDDRSDRNAAETRLPLKQILPKGKLLSYGLNVIFAILIYILLNLAIGADLLETDLLILIGINCIMAISLNLATGLLGELCLGHAGFMAVGAYTAALFVMRGPLPEEIAFPVSLLLGGLVTAVVAFLVGLPALRLRGDYLAIITLAFGQIITILLRSFPMTGGAKGLSGIPFLSTFRSTFIVLVIVIYLIYALIRSRHGRAIMAIREDDIAAEASGINITRFKMLAFVLSAFFAGIAGGLFAMNQGILLPSKFDFNYSIDFMVMVVFGGMGSITGSILSATILTLLPELLRNFSSYRLLIYAVLLIVLMIFKPEGLLGQKEVSQHFFRQLSRRLRALLPNAPSRDRKPAAPVSADDYLTEQGPGDIGVGGGRAKAEENLPPELDPYKIPRKDMIGRASKQERKGGKA